MKNGLLLHRAVLLAFFVAAPHASLWADLVTPQADTSSEQLEAVPAPVSTPDPTPNSAPSTSAANPTPALPVLSYTVVHGDTLASIAQKYGLTVKELKRLNDMPTAKVSVKAGQVLQVVYAKHSSSAKKTSVAAKKKKTTTQSQVAKVNASPSTSSDSVPSEYVEAQPVQSFDLKLNTGSQEAVVRDPNEYSVPDSTETTHAPVAKLVSPSELVFDEQQQEHVAQNKAKAQTQPSQQHVAKTQTSSQQLNATDYQHALRAQPVITASAPAPNNNFQQTQPSAPHKQSFFERLFSNNDDSQAAQDWGAKFLQQARLLGDQGIGYDDAWHPPGEPHSWEMDCSNTTRYLYKVTTGIELPRTASDQYYYLHLQGKAWDVPTGPDGYADVNYLRTNLKPGDLLFWENTYRPERQPPITHVMIFLGTNDKGQWIMAGSQSSRGGEHNRSDGGPDIYVFRPSQPCGGYTTWLGFVHHKGRFCAFGRPLEADRTKLSVASD